MKTLTLIALLTCWLAAGLWAQPRLELSAALGGTFTEGSGWYDFDTSQGSIYQTHARIGLRPSVLLRENLRAGLYLVMARLLAYDKESCRGCNGSVPRNSGSIGLFLDWYVWKGLFLEYGAGYTFIDVPQATTASSEQALGMSQALGYDLLQGHTGTLSFGLHSEFVLTQRPTISILAGFIRIGVQRIKQATATSKP